MGIVLYIVSLVLSVLFYIPGVIYAIYKRAKKGGFKEVNKYFMDKAIATDQFGNVWASELFGDIMIKTDKKYMFGDPDETVSSVLGKNKVRGTLTKLGITLAFILDFIDENHCIKSIEAEEDVYS